MTRTNLAGDAMRRDRIDQGLTQREVADWLEVGVRQVGDMESHRFKRILQPPAALRLAKLLAPQDPFKYLRLVLTDSLWVFGVSAAVTEIASTEAPPPPAPVEAVFGPQLPSEPSLP